MSLLKVRKEEAFAEGYQAGINGETEAEPEAEETATE